MALHPSPETAGRAHHSQIRASLFQTINFPQTALRELEAYPIIICGQALEAEDSAEKADPPQMAEAVAVATAETAEERPRAQAMPRAEMAAADFAVKEAGQKVILTAINVDTEGEDFPPMAWAETGKI